MGATIPVDTCFFFNHTKSKLAHKEPHTHGEAYGSRKGHQTQDPLTQLEREPKNRGTIFVTCKIQVNHLGLHFTSDKQIAQENKNE